MNPILRNILAILAGVIGGSIVNMGIIIIGHFIIGAPEGVDPMDPASIAANIHLYEFHHYLTPFLAHAIGTLVGALLTALIAANRKMLFAMLIGLWFLIGGIVAAIMNSGSVIYIIADLLLAYIPMAWIGAKLGGASKVPAGVD